MKLESELSAAQDAVTAGRKQLQATNDEIIALRGKIGNLEYQSNQLIIAYSELRSERDALRIRAETIDHLDKFPDTLSEMLRLICSWYPDRVVVLKAAYKSADAYKREGGHAEWWSILHSIPTVMWDLRFGDAAEGLSEKSYRARCGYEYSPREGSQTRKNPAFMRELDRQYQGKTIRCEPHIKGRDKNSDFRVYLWHDENRQLIVIGHCGKHLDTAGTDRRSR